MREAGMSETTAHSETQGTVLVTGGSGYIAAFCIAHLLREGWSVRTTIRNLAREAEVRATIGKLTDTGTRLSVVAADLNADDGWDEAVRGCAYVQHVASPLPTSNPKDDDVLIRPARDGALRVMRAAKAAGVKRVVMTASTACISYGHGSYDTPKTEADWSDETNRADTSAYERSKTIAERAVRASFTQEGAPLELVTVHPGAVLGPVLGADFSASIEIVKKLMEGAVPGVPRFGWPLVDVRDIADLHYRAMLAEGIAGERFIGADEFWWMSQVASVLKSRLGSRAKKVPTRGIPDFVVRLSALFDPVIRDRLFELGKSRPVSHAHASAVLGWSPRPNEEAVVATAESLVAEGLV
jgi:dihydroflavonol-4-reductase